MGFYRLWAKQKPINTWDGYNGRTNMFLISDAYKSGVAVKVYRPQVSETQKDGILG